MSLTVPNGDEPVEVKKRYNASIDYRSAFAELVTTLTGKKPEMSFETDMLIGQACRVLIEHHKDEAGNTWDNISKVMPVNNEQKELAS